MSVYAHRHHKLKKRIKKQTKNKKTQKKPQSIRSSLLWQLGQNVADAGFEAHGKQSEIMHRVKNTRMADKGS